MSLSRILPFLFLNIILSAIIGVAILVVWSNRHAADLSDRAAPPPLPSGYVDSEPTAEPIIIPTRYLKTHTVAEGDTLAQIAEENGLGLSELSALNGIDDPNSLQVGQELIVERPAQPTAIPESERTPIPTIALEVGEVMISVGGLVAAVEGDSTTESIALVNDGIDPTSINNWTLSDNDGNVYRFSNVILFGNGISLVLHTGEGVDNTPDLYWGLSEMVWQSGDTATLTDDTDLIRAQFTIP